MLLGRNYLIIISGLVWIAVGMMLINFARIRLEEIEEGERWKYIVAGLILALVKYRLVFRRMVEKNLQRLYGLPEREAFYKFLPNSGYVLVVIMTCLGISLRLFGLEGKFIAIIDITIGFGLFFSGIMHFRKYIRSDCELN